ncbi:MAG: hypothetical protein QOJ40_1090 [Verrucomicrobiota bacterium]
MYKIIGGDRKEYGPVSAEELRRWIAEGRLSGQSLIQAEGSNEWKPLASFAEFADVLGVQARPPVLGVPIAPPVNSEAWSAQILARPAELQIGRCLALSWQLWLDNFGLFFGAAFLVWIISVVCQFIPLGLGGIMYWVFRGVFYGGLYLVFLNRIRGRPALIGDVFSGFKADFAQLLLAGLVSSLLSMIGFFFCILPGLYLMVTWIFSIPLVADRRLEFWSAMELSRKVVTRVWFPMLGLMVLAFLPFLLVNIFSAMKAGTALVSAIQEVMKSGQPDIHRIMGVQSGMVKAILPFMVVMKLVFLLNWPFAIGTLMYAYENLFGTRPAPTT